MLHAEGDRHAIMLRFGPDATIDEHSHHSPVEVICLQGSGFTSIAGERAAIAAGEKTTWPAGQDHRLWTESEPMIVLLLHYEG